jgi:hypothetical protein
VQALLATIEDAKAANKQLHVLLVDAEHAFDSVEPWALAALYKRLGLPPALARLMSQIDGEGIAQVLTPVGLTSRYHIERGTRQGEVLSPLKFVLWLHMWFEYHSRRFPDDADGYQFAAGTTARLRMSKLGYADDITMVASTAAGLQRMAMTLCDFLAYFGVSLSAKKTLYVARHGKRVPQLKLKRFDRLTGHVHRWSLKAKGPKHTFRCLGAVLNLDLDWERCKLPVVLKANAFLQLLETRKLSLQGATLATSAVLRGQFQFYLQMTWLPNNVVRGWDARLRKVLRRRQLLLPATTAAHHGLELAEHGLGLSTVDALRAVICGSELLTLLCTPGVAGDAARARFAEMPHRTRARGGLVTQAISTGSAIATQKANRCAHVQQLLRTLSMRIATVDDIEATQGPSPRRRGGVSLGHCRAAVLNPGGGEHPPPGGRRGSAGRG